ncbi:hypothetical protein [Streptomyces sp. H34-S4]|nr:hypothetical protein [Streptomyces sp. H34-S4]MCY0939635.1 hypothetical protein [Streptomyces sp. H34-S4]
MAGDFTRCDTHAVREHRHAIDLVRYRHFGSERVGWGLGPGCRPGRTG